MADSFIKVTLPNTLQAQERVAEYKTLGFIESDDQITAWFKEGSDLQALIEEFNSKAIKVEEKDWNRAYLEQLKETDIGIFRIIPLGIWKRNLQFEITSTPDNISGSRRIPIIIDPGAGFGTGDHETTRGALALLSRCVFPGAIVLDLGCGSGILAIAAKKLGAEKVFAVEIDPNALKNARKNTELNDVELFFYSELEKVEDNKFDIIVANIQADVLKDYEEKLLSYAKPGGTLIHSGILRKENFTPPYPLLNKILEGEWQSLLFQKPRNLQNTK